VIAPTQGPHAVRVHVPADGASALPGWLRVAGAGFNDFVFAPGAADVPVETGVTDALVAIIQAGDDGEAAVQAGGTFVRPDATLRADLTASDRWREVGA